jgi:hypothetical protein
MTLALLLVIQTQIVDIQNLTPQEHRVAAFVLTAPQSLQVTAVGGEPRPDRRRTRDKDDWQNDEQTTWPAAAWILDARTRAVVWDLRSVESDRASNGLRHFSGMVQLPAGLYEAHYASYPAAVVSTNGQFDLRALARLGRRLRYGGPYVDDGTYKEFRLTIAVPPGAGRAATSDEVEAAHAAFMASSIASVVPDQGGSARQGFELTRPADVEVYAIGEVRQDGAFDYGWIINADTHERVWKMEYGNSEPAGGAQKNRMVHETLRLKPGRYAAYFVSDASHGPEEWNSVPATDPEFWGLTLRVADAAARTGVRPYTYEPVPAGQTLVSLIRIGDDETRSAGFTLRRAMDVRIYAIGEVSGSDMVDYAWIVDATRHRRVWTMSYENTEHAGGAEKNRLFDGTVHLDAGSYMVHYTSDGSHSYDDWNSSAPAEDRYWGVSVFPASGRLNQADAGPYERPSGGTMVAELVRIGDGEKARTPFRLERETKLRIYALGEGNSGQMFDYGWIEDDNGRVVWQMHYEESDPAGGASKNRVFEGTITLPAGNYVLRYASDGSHSFGDWNDDPPDDPESWGISIFRIEDR